MSVNLNFAELFSKCKKNLAFAFFSAVVLAGVLFIEVRAASNVILPEVQGNFNVLESSKETVWLTYDFNQEPTLLQNNFAAPKIIQTKQDPATVRVLESSFIALGANTQLNTLVFTRDRYHAVLMDGELILNNLTENRQVSIQVGNTLLSPYPRGVYYLSKKDNNLEIHILKGNADIGVYSGNGNLSRQILLSRYNKISAFDAFPAEGDLEVEKPIIENRFFSEINELNLLPSIHQLIQTQNIFALTYKEQLVEPTTKSRLSSQLTNLSFNQQRRDFYSIANFYSELNSIINSAATQRVNGDQIPKLRAIYNTEIANNPSALNFFRSTLEEKYPFILAIRPNDNLFELKLYLQSLMRNIPPSEILISSLEDLYLLFPEGRTATIARTFENLRELVPAIGREDARKIISILDNLAETTVTANTRDLFEVRNLLSEKLSTTIERSQFRSKSRQHITRLQVIYRLNQLPTSTLRGATEALLLSLDSASQIEYQNFLLQLR